MNKEIKYFADVLQSNGLIMEDEITESNYREVFNRIADDIDSLLYMSLLVEIEEYYQVQLPDEVLVENIFYDIDDFIILLNDKINNKPEEVSKGES